MKHSIESYSRSIDFGIILEKNYSLQTAYDFLQNNPLCSNLVLASHHKWGEDIIFFEYGCASFCVISAKGSPITACAVEKIRRYGGRAVVFIGTCGSTNEDIKDGTYVFPYAAVRDEGTSTGYIDIKCPAVADIQFTMALYSKFSSLTKTKIGVAYTTDKRYKENPEELKLLHTRLNVLSIDMETSAFFVVSQYHGMPSAAIRIVTDCAVKETSDTLKGVYNGSEPFSVFITPKLLFAFEHAITGILDYFHHE